MKTKFKEGDKLQYIGPPRTVYQNPKDHPSYYTDWKIVTMRAVYGVDHPFCLTTCAEKAHTDVKCTGHRYIDSKEWEVVP